MMGAVSTSHPLVPALQAAVPIEIARLRDKGGPDEDDLRACRDQLARILSHGDVLLFGGRKGEAARLFASLARAIAVMAFAPGGVRIFGQHWEATTDERSG